LLLLHGLISSSACWRRVVPLLAPHHTVVAPTCLGHRGGATPTLHPVRVEHLVDDVERCMDALQLARAHVAGNSLGGWVALELSRRGRALSVCALSPAGVWESARREPAARMLRDAARSARRLRPVVPLMAPIPALRRALLRDVAVHGERVGASELIGIVADAVGCTVYEDLLDTPERLMPLGEVSCPVTFAWSGCDRLFPAHVHGTRARELVPGARFLVLDGVGHVPMYDAPQRVADTILQSTALAIRKRPPRSA
jgi:pimeloyl-ACP methyl ester carboxylesterase